MLESKISFESEVFPQVAISPPKQPTRMPNIIIREINAVGAYACQSYVRNAKRRSLTTAFNTLAAFVMHLQQQQVFWLAGRDEPQKG